MLENTLGGCKEREWKTSGGHICLWWHILVRVEDFAICCLSCSCEDMKVGLETCHGPWYYPALELWGSRSFSFIRTLTRAQLQAHAYIRACCLAPIIHLYWSNIQGSKFAFASKTAEINTLSLWSLWINELVADCCGSTLSGLCSQAQETVCTNIHTLYPPYQCFSCLCSSYTLYHVGNVN